MQKNIFVSLALAFLFLPGCMSISEKACGLKTAMRKLWADHVIWTRDYIIAAVANNDDQKAASARLLKNQEDIGAAVGQYYGKEAGDKLTALLKDHILIGVDVVAAAKANNKENLTTADKKWHDNAQEIATFLSGANSYWSQKDLVDMLYMHLKLTTEEAVARIKKSWDADIEAFDAIFNQAMEMADTFTMGIRKQFPNKF